MRRSTMSGLGSSPKKLLKSPDRARVAMCVNSVCRVTYSEPLAPRMPGAKAGAGPLALPKLAIRPKGRRQFRLPSQVSLPTLS